MARMSAALQLASWVGRKGRGSARLRWGGRELVIHVNALQIIAVEGDDNEKLASSFGLTSGGEWFREAQAAVTSGQVSQGEANAVVKRALAETLREFFCATDATVTFSPGMQPEPTHLTISYPHLVVELLLGNDGDELVGVFLPHPEWLLRRLPDFLRRVGALGLTDEAMAILAKINDQRTAQEIADPSPHGRELALRLLAAAAGGGLIEANPRLAELPLAASPVEEPAPAPSRRRAWLWLLLVLLLAAAAVAVAVLEPWKPRQAAGSGGPWAIAVDGGDQPAELERLYRRQDSDPTNFRVVPFGGGDQRNYRLVWGHFPTRENAERALPDLPESALTRGFAPHVVQVEGTGP
ncbi:MAG: SPOR domain-containing protein [Acidobacteriota bacterium]